MSRLRAVFAFVSFCSLTIAGTAQEKKISRSDLPGAVEKTVQAESAGATIRGFSSEREHGKTVYELEMVVGGRGKDVSIAADGAVLEVEEEVAFEALPKPVRDALNSRANGARIVKVESLQKKGQLVAYEATTEKAGRHGEVQVGPGGEKLIHTE